ncbi:MAG: hypothetical protein JNL98_00715 [Bryobacterales bacterium]|nr:hypothetical protein [Bryobacterales bacterium]
MSRSLIALLLFASIALAQQATISLTPAEQAFQTSMTNVTLTGYFTVGDGSETRPDKYTVEKVEKIGDDLWSFDARIQYGTRDYRAKVKVPVKWAGDTPVITLASYLIQGHGVYSARILIHNGQYAGTWGGAEGKGGKMFGNVVKNTTAPANP